MPKVKLRRTWFAPNHVRYRPYHTHGLADVPDKMVKHLPKDAKVKDAKPEAEEDVEEVEEVDENDQSAYEEHLVEEQDPTAAFKEALKAENGEVQAHVDVAGAADAAQSAASKAKPKPRARSTRTKK